MKKRDQAHAHVPVWEWILAGIGAALVCSSFGFLAYKVITGNSTPPDIVIALESVTPSQTSYLAKVTVENRGDAAAADVYIEAQLMAGNALIEKSEIRIDYLPSHSRRIGGLFFTKDLRTYRLIMKAKGYREP